MRRSPSGYPARAEREPDVSPRRQVWCRALQAQDDAAHRAHHLDAELQQPVAQPGRLRAGGARRARRRTAATPVSARRRSPSAGRATGLPRTLGNWCGRSAEPSVEVAPVPRTPILLARRRSPRCRSRDRRTRRHSDSRWSSWFGPDVHRGNWLGNSSRRPRRYETGSRRLIATRASAPMACAPKNMRRFVGCAGRTGGCAKNAKSWQKPRPGSRGRPDPGGLPVQGAFPISRSRAHTHRRHGHPLQTVPSAGLIERPQEKNRVDALR